jgi:hypothetical protein
MPDDKPTDPYQAFTESMLRNMAAKADVSYEDLTAEFASVDPAIVQRQRAYLGEPKLLFGMTRQWINPVRNTDDVFAPALAETIEVIHDDIVAAFSHLAGRPVDPQEKVLALMTEIDAKAQIAKLNPMDAAPRDGTVILIETKDDGTIPARLLKLVYQTRTDFFWVPADVSDTNASEIIERELSPDDCLGWVPAKP